MNRCRIPGKEIQIRGKLVSDSHKQITPELLAKTKKMIERKARS